MLVVSCFFFLLGASIGSFLLCLSHRMPRNKNILTPSYCPKCKHKLPIFTLLPILSYLLLRGKCTICKKNIPLCYPLIEILCGIIFYLVWYKIGIKWELGYFLFSWSIFLLIAIIDWQNKWFYSLLPILVLLSHSLYLFYLPTNLLASFLGMLIGAGFFYFVAFFYQFCCKKQGLGEGDITLLGTLGYFLGWEALLPIVIYSSILGILIGVWLLFKNKKNSPFPFTPALIIGAFFHWYYPQAYYYLSSIQII